MKLERHPGGMYPIDVQALVRRGTRGSRATDPTIPYRPSPYARLKLALSRDRETRIRTAPREGGALARAISRL